MKEGWEVKKLGEVCDIYQPKTISTSALVENGKYLVYGANGVIGKYDQYNHTESELLMTCRGATCGTINISEPYSWINGNAMVIHPFEGNITMSYLKYVLRGIDLSNVITGAAQPQITRQSLSPLLIPIPPLPEQSRIVEELDLLSNIIEKKRQQLSELDNLAQSIFYDMFGDPVENEKGWKTLFLEKLISTGIITYHLDGNHGSDYPRREEFVENGIIYIGANCIENGLINFKLAKYLTEEKVKTLRKGIAKNNDVLFAHNASVGPVAHLRTTEEVIILSTSLTAFRCNELFMNPLFLRAYMCSEWFIPQYQKLMKQTTRNQIPITQQRKMLFINPPVDLQNKFASKIEAIEKQKELIKQSIAETEELFNSRMDYYFS